MLAQTLHQTTSSHACLFIVIVVHHLRFLLCCGLINDLLQAGHISDSEILAPEGDSICNLTVN